MTDIDQQALVVAREIENIFCRSFEGGVYQRQAAIQVVVAKAMRQIWDRRVERVTQLSIEEAAPRADG